MASLVPEPTGLDDELYFVFCDYGEFGRAFVETSPERSSREAVVRDIVEGQHDRPLRVLALNPAEGWSRDVSREIAQEVVAQGGNSDFGPGVRAFIEEQLGQEAHA